MVACISNDKLTSIMTQITNELGFGLKESVYQNALAVELRFQGFNVELEVNKTILYRGHDVGTVRLDMVVSTLPAGAVTSWGGPREGQPVWWGR